MNATSIYFTRHVPAHTPPWFGIVVASLVAPCRSNIVPCLRLYEPSRAHSVRDFQALRNAEQRRQNGTHTLLADSGYAGAGLLVGYAALPLRFRANIVPQRKLRKRLSSTATIRSRISGFPPHSLQSSLPATAFRQPQVAKDSQSSSTTHRLRWRRMHVAQTRCLAVRQQVYIDCYYALLLADTIPW